MLTLVKQNGKRWRRASYAGLGFFPSARISTAGRPFTAVPASTPGAHRCPVTRECGAGPVRGEQDCRMLLGQPQQHQGWAIRGSAGRLPGLDQLRADVEVMGEDRLGRFQPGAELLDLSGAHTGRWRR